LARGYAHHILRRPQTSQKSLTEIREQEEEADRWASSAVLRAKIGPIVGAYPFILFAAYDCDAILHEQARDHPADIRRLDAVIQASIDGLDKLQLPAGTDRQTVRSNLKTLHAKLVAEIKAEISCLE